MKTTYIDALNVFMSGDTDKAWEVAQEDEGLIPGTTKEQWVQFVKDTIVKKLLETLTSNGPTMDRSEMFITSLKSQRYIRALFNIYHGSGYEVTP